MNGPTATGLVMRPAALQTMAVALVVSLLVHAALYGGYRGIKALNLNGYERFIARFMPKSSGMTPALLKWLLPKPNPTQPRRSALQEIAMVIQRNLPETPPPAPAPPPSVFVPVDPIQATVEEPKDAKYYSDKNSQAANPEIKKPADQPNIDGKQKNVPRTVDTKPQNLQPAPVQNPQPRPPDKKAAEEKQPDEKESDVPKPPVKEPPAERPKPAGGQAPGNLAMAKPVEQPSLNIGKALQKPGQGEQHREGTSTEPTPKTSRPRSLIEARSRMQDNTIAGQKMQQEGGVRNRLAFSALDAKATPFGAYDTALVAAIQARWYDLLERARYSGDKRGHVVIQFRLHSTGRITDVTLGDNTVGDFLASVCQSAIMDPAPYPKWPQEMQRLFSGGYREVRFTFYYD